MGGQHLDRARLGSAAYAMTTPNPATRAGSSESSEPAGRYKAVPGGCSSGRTAPRYVVATTAASVRTETPMSVQPTARSRAAPGGRIAIAAATSRPGADAARTDAGSRPPAIAHVTAIAPAVTRYSAGQC